MPYQSPRGDRQAWSVRIFLPAILRSLWVTARRLLHMRSQQSRNSLAPPSRARRLHRLMRREDGTVRCTACMLCMTACPTGCISVEGMETAEPSQERKPDHFTIDLLRCIACGRCVEACPCDALRMDVPGFLPASADRASFLLNMKQLLANTPEGESALSRAL